MRLAESITLSPEERSSIDTGSTGRSFPYRLGQRARIIRMAADGALNQDIARKLQIFRPTVQLGRQRFLSLRLPDKRGVVGLYPVADTGDKENPELELDLGFKIYNDIPKAWAGKVKAGDILDARQNKFRPFKPSGISAKTLLYTYAVRLSRVVDGDTLWVKILPGFGLKNRRKLRMNKIDAPEIDTPKGKEARAYVERALKSVNVFVIKTCSTDVHDRYPVDIFYSVGKYNENTSLLLGKFSSSLESGNFPRL